MTTLAGKTHGEEANDGAGTDNIGKASRRHGIAAPAAADRARKQVVR